MKNRFMKNTVLVLAAVLTLGLLAGCGNTQPAEEETSGSAETEGAGVDLESIKTLGDAFTLEGKDEYSEQRASYGGKYVYAFAVDGVAYRVIADLPDDIFDQILELDFDEDYDKKEQALVKDLEVTTAENLTEQILSQEELDALVGKTGQELFDAGWRSGMFYNTETMEVWLEYRSARH